LSGPVDGLDDSVGTCLYSSIVSKRSLLLCQPDLFFARNFGRRTSASTTTTDIRATLLIPAASIDNLAAAIAVVAVAAVAADRGGCGGVGSGRGSFVRIFGCRLIFGIACRLIFGLGFVWVRLHLDESSSHSGSPIGEALSTGIADHLFKFSSFFLCQIAFNNLPFFFFIINVYLTVSTTSKEHHVLARVRGQRNRSIPRIRR